MSLSTLLIVFIARQNAFCRKMERVLPQKGMHFAAKWNAFCRKTECVLAQNGMHFAAKWNAFWPKMGKLKDYLVTVKK